MTISRITAIVVLVMVICCVGLTVYVFAASRADPGLRMAALVAATGISSALMATASTLLTGKDLTRHPDPADLPPNSTQQTIDTVKTGPLDVSK